MKTKVDSGDDDDLPLNKPLNIDNVLVFVKSLFNKNYNHYYIKCF